MSHVAKGYFASVIGLLTLALIALVGTLVTVWMGLPESTFVSNFGSAALASLATMWQLSSRDKSDYPQPTEETQEATQ